MAWKYSHLPSGPTSNWPISTSLRRVGFPVPSGIGAFGAIRRLPSAIADGSVRAFGVTARERLGFPPDVPTMDEGGVKGFELAIWHGFYAPRNTPRSIREKLTAALEKALGHPMLTERYAQIGAVPVRPDAATPASLAGKLAAEIARWTPVLKDASS